MSVSPFSEQMVRSDKWLTLRTSVLECIYSGQITLLTLLIKPSILLNSPLMQHNSFFNPLIQSNKVSARHSVSCQVFLELKAFQVLLTLSNFHIPRDPPFEPKPSLKLVCDFLVAQCVRPCPQETCPICQQRALPDEPKVLYYREQSKG